MPTTRLNTCKLCRREGVSLCGRDRCAFKRRAYPPGMHGPKFARSKQRLSSYGIQLREKQKAKRLYNIMERQFRRYFEEAAKKKGNTAEFLVKMLEARLDNAVYRLGFAKTRRQARQMVGHGFFSVNGKKVDVPSYRLRVGDVVEPRANKKEKKIFEGISDRLDKHQTPAWLSLDTGSRQGKMTSDPTGEDLRQIFDPTLIVEFYSR